MNLSAGTNLHSYLPHDSSSSEDEEERFQREEEEKEERLLTRQHGEASETTSTNRNSKKRSHQTDAEIAQALMDKFVEGEFDKIELVYNRFKNAATQIVTTEQFFLNCMHS